MTKTLLKWLYFGNLLCVIKILGYLEIWLLNDPRSGSIAMENDKKILGPILRPYLGNLFNVSHENAWHIESCRKRKDIYNSEMRSLALFCKLVTAQEISPADGIVDSLSKGWNWAEHVTRMIERSNNGLKLIFLTRQKTLKYNLTFANNKGLSAFSTWSKARNIGNATRRAIIARTNIITATDGLPSWNEGSVSGGKLSEGKKEVERERRGRRQDNRLISQDVTTHNMLHIHICICMNDFIIRHSLMIIHNNLRKFILSPLIPSGCFRRNLLANPKRTAL